MIWRIKTRKISFPHTLVVGILNVTPDSFSDGGKFFNPEKAVQHALQLEKEGADILDLGGESTRPGAETIETGEELKRILPILQALKNKIQIPISVDTTKPEVARICLEEGAEIINDVSGLKDSGQAMAEVIRDSGAGLILMHRRGNPQTMQSLARYYDVVQQVIGELRESVDSALAAGIEAKQLVIDPGLGFAKTAEQNFEILSQLERFHELGLPVMLGPSRKTFIGKVTGREAEDRDYGTAAVAAYAVMKQIQLIRVHAPAATRDVIRTLEAIKGAQHVGTF
ncbi:MAG: dihydropteroate synthase [Candidatus Omnitrophica bacterium]|nr:dihydropteroate synthase [Candidatus Omnitrophota bacterium]